MLGLLKGSAYVGHVGHIGRVAGQYNTQKRDMKFVSFYADGWTSTHTYRQLCALSCSACLRKVQKSVPELTTVDLGCRKR